MEFIIAITSVTILIGGLVIIGIRMELIKDILFIEK